MGSKTDPSGVIRFERTARRDFRHWAMLLFGAVFLYGGLTIDPQTNCSENGECAPWLVPVAAVVGLTVSGAGLSQLMANASRGSRFDPSANRLEWWQNRTRKYPGDSGSIAIDQIARIRITRDDDRNEISLYGHDGERLHFFDTEVIHWNIDRWAEQARSAAPWIALEEVDRTHRPPRKG